MSPKNNWQHGDICTQLLIAIGTHAKHHNLGAVWDSSTGFWMRNRNCRAPDIAFVSKARLKGRKRSERQFFPGAPDLAVEVFAHPILAPRLTAGSRTSLPAGPKSPGSLTLKNNVPKFVSRSLIENSSEAAHF